MTVARRPVGGATEVRGGRIVYLAPRPPYGAGNWKDIEGRRLALEALGIEVQLCQGLSAGALLGLDLAEVDQLLVEYSTMGSVLIKLKRAWPHLRIHARVHNAEALQFLHRSTPSIRHPGSLVQTAWRFLGALRQDRLTARASDALLGISEWDQANYWRRIAPVSKLWTLPYYCPWPWLDDATEPLRWDRRKRQIVCMPGGRDPIGRDIVSGFRRLTEHLASDASASGWRFAVTAGARSDERGPEKAFPGVPLHHVPGDEPWSLLGESRAVAVLSARGFGMKTTIIDGIAAGAHVLVDHRLAARLPREIRERCLAVDLRRLPPPGAILAQLAEPPPESALNSVLRARAIRTLENVLS